MGNWEICTFLSRSHNGFKQQAAPLSACTVARYIWMGFAVLNISQMKDEYEYFVRYQETSFTSATKQLSMQRCVYRAASLLD